MRLIDADALMEKYHKTAVWDSWIEIEAAPTVDAVPVVLCEDCKHHKHNELFGTHVCKLKKLRIKPYDYCSYGERREEE